MKASGDPGPDHYRKEAKLMMLMGLAPLLLALVAGLAIQILGVSC